MLRDVNTFLASIPAGERFQPVERPALAEIRKTPVKPALLQREINPVSFGYGGGRNGVTGQAGKAMSLTQAIAKPLVEEAVDAPAGLQAGLGLPVSPASKAG